MAKTPKLKTPSKPSTHSRASRRASSPSLAANLEKSPTNAPKPTTKKPHILAPQPGAGISKPSKKKSGKILKRKQKLRLEHGKEKAEAVNGKLERKVERAEEMREGKKGRNAPWDDLNEKISGRKRAKKDKATKAEEGEDDDDAAWEDDQEMEVDAHNVADTAVENEGASNAIALVEETVALPETIQADWNESENEDEVVDEIS